MGLNLSNTFNKANTILNDKVGKFDLLNLVGVDQTTNSLVYLVQGITKGFYYRGTSGAQGEALEVLRIVPEDSTIETALQNCAIFELRNLDGSFVRYTAVAKKPPERPSFQWVFTLKPNMQDKRPIT